jgi:hypothetical protein
MTRLPAASRRRESTSVAQEGPRTESAGRLRELVAERDALRFSAMGIVGTSQRLHQPLKAVSPWRGTQAMRPWPIPPSSPAPRQYARLVDDDGDSIHPVRGPWISGRNKLGEARILRGFPAKLLVTSGVDCRRGRVAASPLLSRAFAVRLRAMKTAVAIIVSIICC